MIALGISLGQIRLHFEMELKQLRALQAIADTGSFAEAAAQLEMTPSALSHQIRNLEAELDETLLIRARPQVYPSAAGLRVLAAAEKIQAELMSLEMQFARAKAGPVTGTLRIAATTLSIVYVLGDLCETFMEKYPGIELVFTATESAEAALRRVLNGTADIAFGPLEDNNPQLVRIALARTDHAFIARNGHPLSRQAAVTLDQLREFPFVLFQPGSGTRAITDDLFLPRGGYSSVLTESNDAQFIKRMVSIGSGVALMPAYALAEELASRKLALLRCTEKPVVVEIGIAHKKSVMMHTIELFKSMCLDLRGPTLANLTTANVGVAPFASQGSPMRAR